MATNRRSTLPSDAWAEVQVESLSDTQRQAFLAYKAAYALAREARDAFEATVQPAAPPNKHFVFGYNFGKLSVAVAEGAPPAPRAKTAAKGPVSLATLTGQPAGQPAPTLVKAAPRTAQKANGAERPTA